MAEEEKVVSLEEQLRAFDEDNRAADVLMYKLRHADRGGLLYREQPTQPDDGPPIDWAGQRRDQDIEQKLRAYVDQQLRQGINEMIDLVGDVMSDHLKQISDEVRDVIKRVVDLEISSTHRAGAAADRVLDGLALVGGRLDDLNTKMEAMRTGDVVVPLKKAH